MCTRRKHTTVTKTNDKEMLVTVNARLTLADSLGRSSERRETIANENTNGSGRRVATRKLHGTR